MRALVRTAQLFVDTEYCADLLYVLMCLDVEAVVRLHLAQNFMFSKDPFVISV